MRVTVTIKNDKRTAKRLRDIAKKNMMFAKNFTRDVAVRTTKLMKEKVLASGAVFTTDLLQGITTRSSPPDSWIVRVPEQGLFVNTGVRPHWVHKDMVSVNGLKVEEWMRANGRTGDWMFVGAKAGPVKKPGTKFIDESIDEIRNYARVKVRDYSKEVLT